MSEKQTAIVLKELSKEKAIDQDKAVNCFLPEFILHIFEKTHGMNREEVLQHLATQEEILGMNGFDEAEN